MDDNFERRANNTAEILKMARVFENAGALKKESAEDMAIRSEEVFEKAYQTKRQDEQE